MNCRARSTQRIANRVQVIKVAGHHIIIESHGQVDQMGVDHIGGCRTGDELTNLFAVVKRMDSHSLQELRQPGLASTVAPNLCYHRMCCVQRPNSTLGREQGERAAFSAINGDEDACVEDHRP